MATITICGSLPDDPKTMIEANDGGANDHARRRAHLVHGGRTSRRRSSTGWRWTNDFPYHIYGAQQDNTTVRIASRTAGGAIGDDDWYDVGGGESGWIAPDPRNSQIVYAGSYDGLLTRQDKRTGQSRNINAWPDNTMGYGVEAMKYRFQWNFPIAFSPHDPKALYIGANVLLADHQRGAELGRDQQGSDAQRQIQDGQFGRADHAGQHQRRVLLHDLHVHGIAGDEGRDLDGVRRWAGEFDARWRQDVGERHAAGHAGMDPHQLDRRFGARRRARRT